MKFTLLPCVLVLASALVQALPPADQVDSPVSVTEPDTLIENGLRGLSSNDNKGLNVRRATRSKILPNGHTARVARVHHHAPVMDTM
ncbi:hypothetical protein B7463_g6013, partial [Scytalidium lignicola]